MLGQVKIMDKNLWILGLLFFIFSFFFFCDKANKRYFPSIYLKGCSDAFVADPKSLLYNFLDEPENNNFNFQFCYETYSYSVDKDRLWAILKNTALYFLQKNFLRIINKIIKLKPVLLAPETFGARPCISHKLKTLQNT